MHQAVTKESQSLPRTARHRPTSSPGKALQGMDYASGAALLSPQAGAGKDPSETAGGTSARFEGDLFIQGQGDAAAIDPNDVRQGSLGDCYLLAALRSVARTDPQCIRDMVKDNGNGTYTVRFFLDRLGISLLGRGTKEVTVSAVVPTTPTGSPRYAKTGDALVVNGKTRFELWAMIVEKAWAKLKGGYPQIAGGNPGQAMEAITGKTSDSFRPSSRSALDVLSALERAEKDRHPVTCFTPKVEAGAGTDGKHGKKKKAWNALADRLGVYASHAYSFKSVKDGRISLENPWGYDHPLPMTAEEFRSLFVEVNINRA